MGLNLNVGDSGTVARLLERVVRPDQAFILVALGVLFLLVCVWVFLKHAFRVALLIVLFVLGPLAQACWVLPQTQGYFRGWHQLFWSRLAAQLVSSLALKVALSFVITAGDSPVATLLCLGLLLVAAQAPELLGLTTGGLSLSSVLQVAWLARSFGGPAGAAAGIATTAANGAGAAASAAPVARPGSLGWTGSATRKADAARAATGAPATAKATWFVPGGFGPTRGWGRGGRKAA